MKNVLVIGVGPHARRSHLPTLASGQAAGLIADLHGVDIIGAAGPQTSFLSEEGSRAVPMTLIEPFEPQLPQLPSNVEHTLDRTVAKRRIDAVIVATEPAYHRVYVHWALDRGLSVLLDKPLSIRPHASTNATQAAAIRTDFDDLLEHYHRARDAHPDIMVSVQAQRRYHPAFWQMRSLISEVAASTGCPVTSIQSFHSDGQWRLPNELVDLAYHGYSSGYGKCAHSGYHFFDIVPWLANAAQHSDHPLDSITVTSHITRPSDVLSHMDLADYERLLPGFADANPYTAEHLQALTHGFGEVDAFISAALRNGDRTMTLASINLIHNGFSQRGSLSPAAELYKGNGRVRQETHVVQQGPFQAIHLHSLQTLRKEPADPTYTVGGSDHVELHVFRNNQVRPDWQAYRHLDHRELTSSHAGHDIFPTQRSSRHRCTWEFLEYLNGQRTRTQMRSELDSHRTAATLMSAAYLSMARQWNGVCPQAVMGLGPTPRTLQDLASGAAW